MVVVVMILRCGDGGGIRGYGDGRDCRKEAAQMRPGWLSSGGGAVGPSPEIPDSLVNLFPG